MHGKRCGLKGFSERGNALVYGILATFCVADAIRFHVGVLRNFTANWFNMTIMSPPLVVRQPRPVRAEGVDGYPDLVASFGAGKQRRDEVSGGSDSGGASPTGTPKCSTCGRRSPIPHDALPLSREDSDLWDGKLWEISGDVSAARDEISPPPVPTARNYLTEGVRGLFSKLSSSYVAPARSKTPPKQKTLLSNPLEFIFWVVHNPSTFGDFNPYLYLFMHCLETVLWRDREARKHKSPRTIVPLSFTIIGRNYDFQTSINIWWERLLLIAEHAPCCDLLEYDKVDAFTVIGRYADRPVCVFKLIVTNAIVPKRHGESGFHTIDEATQWNLEDQMRQDVLNAFGIREYESMLSPVTVGFFDNHAYDIIAGDIQSRAQRHLVPISPALITGEMKSYLGRHRIEGDPEEIAVGPFLPSAQFFERVTPLPQDLLKFLANQGGRKVTCLVASFGLVDSDKLRQAVEEIAHEREDRWSFIAIRLGVFKQRPNIWYPPAGTYIEFALLARVCHVWVNQMGAMSAYLGMLYGLPQIRLPDAGSEGSNKTWNAQKVHEHSMLTGHIYERSSSGLFRYPDLKSQLRYSIEQALNPGSIQQGRALRKSVEAYHGSATAHPSWATIHVSSFLFEMIVPDSRRTSFTRWLREKKEFGMWLAQLHDSIGIFTKLWKAISWWVSGFS